ncbi:frataxin, mitochondrial [Olea europaea subsp. europaea]|uniref:ferroxidase n=1 Tax=Olea europaea subsp. europaea TaxID=158383 RepID=A0A8S0UJV3_OLEEU|nr:frataxin, mitochondrial [Olea europaea subsp. europaea]
MATRSSAKILQLTRTLCRSLKHQSSSLFQLQPRRSFLYSFSTYFTEYWSSPVNPRRSLSLCSYSSLSEESQAPTAINYSSLLPEEKYHSLANSTIHDLLEKLEEYGDSLDIDGYDIDYGNEVLTLKLGAAGTYVINKQTPNRQIWMSSPVSGPSRFDWDQNAQAWIYRRTKGDLMKVLETELEQLCGKSIDLSSIQF